MEMFALFQCLRPPMTTTTLRPRQRMALAMLVMTGRVTMLSLSRWAGKGGRDRTVQRVCSQALPWARRFGVFFRQPISRPGDVYLLAGDAVVVTKAGKHTYGLDRFFARLDSQVVPGLSCFARSVVSVPARRSCPIRVEPIVRRAAEKAARKAKAAATKPPPSPTRRGPGRPQGRTNHVRAAVTRTPAWVRSSSMLEALRHLITPSLPLTSLGLDGHLGHHNAWHMAQQCRVQLISQWRSDAALDGPYEGSYAGRGPHRQ